MAACRSRFASLYQRGHLTPARSRFCANRRHFGLGRWLLPDRTEAVPALNDPAELLGLKYLDKDELKDRFAEYDKDHNGEIDVREALQILHDAGCKKASEEHAALLISQFDADKSKTISWDEFHELVKKSAEPVDRRVTPISFCLALHWLGAGTQQPILPILARDLGLSHADLGLITSSSAMVRILCNIPMASMAESLGRRPLLIAGPALSAAAMACIGMSNAFSNSFTGLLCCNAVAGLGGTAITAAAGLYLNDIATPLNRSRTTAPMMSTSLLGFSIGPALGGSLAGMYGLHIPFFACAGGMALSSACAATLLPETRRAQASTKKVAPALEQWKVLAGKPPLQGIMSVVFMMGFTQGAAPVTTVLFASEHLGMTPLGIGGTFTMQVLGMVCVMNPAAKLSDAAAKRGERLSVVLPGLAVAASTLLLRSLTASPEAFVALGVVGSMGTAVVMPNISAFIMDHTKADERAQGLAMQRMSQDVGLLTGAGSMGLAASLLGVPMAMEITAILQAAAAIVLAVRKKARTNS